MKTITRALLLTGTAALLLGPAIDSSQARTRHRTHGHSVRAQQRTTARAPGFSPQTDAKQSATGGQAGGQPGQE